MKQTLTFITFLLLLLPVWKDCTHKAPVLTDDDINVINTAAKEPTFDNFLKIFEWDKNCQSGYKQVWNLIECVKEKKSGVKNNKNEIANDTNDTKNEKNSIVKTFIDTFVIIGLFYSFTIYLLISIVLAVFSFTKKRKTFIWLSSINLFVIIWAYIVYFDLSSAFYQIKFGFYLLIINSLLILLSNFLCKKK